MQQLIFPISPDGPCLDVRVNLPVARLHSLQHARQAIPSSIAGKGLVDTGSDVSAVAASILRQLAVPVYGHQKTHAIGGHIPVRLFQVSLFLLDVNQPHLPWMVQPDLLVMELPSGLPVDVLIGMDVLLTCKFLLDGPARQFTLEF
jgi:hypothetical protein